MRDWKLDEYHDLAIDGNDMAVVDGLDEMVQACRVALLTVKYEYWLDGNLGVPWNHGMFWPWTTQAEKELHVRHALYTVTGVTNVGGLVYSDDKENKSSLVQLDQIETTEGAITGIGL